MNHYHHFCQRSAGAQAAERADEIGLPFEPEYVELTPEILDTLLKMQAIELSLQFWFDQPNWETPENLADFGLWEQLNGFEPYEDMRLRIARFEEYVIP